MAACSKCCGASRRQPSRKQRCRPLQSYGPPSRNRQQRAWTEITCTSSHDKTGLEVKKTSCARGSRSRSPSRGSRASVAAPRRPAPADHVLGVGNSLRLRIGSASATPNMSTPPRPGLRGWPLAQSITHSPRIPHCGCGSDRSPSRPIACSCVQPRHVHIYSRRAPATRTGRAKPPPQHGLAATRPQTPPGHPTATPYRR